MMEGEGRLRRVGEGEGEGLKRRDAAPEGEDEAAVGMRLPGALVRAAPSAEAVGVAAAAAAAAAAKAEEAASTTD